MKYKHHSPYYIEWFDHCNDQGQWKEFSNNSFQPVVIKTLGWVVSDETTHVILAQNIEISDNPDSCSHMLILKSCIKKSKKLLQ
jgi:hypothetical protein